MNRKIDPREVLKSILQGAAPSRPLFLPIVFSYAARIENLPLRTFLANPTKITQALRQIRSHFRSDGLTCYFDPYLEVEALGATLEWGATEQASIRWVRNPLNGDLPGGLRSLEELPSRGRIPVAVEVIRRLKSLMRDECLLTVEISGPFALAAQLMPHGPGSSNEAEVSPAALELASGAIAPVATAFAEAGANVVFIREGSPATASAFSDLAAVLETTINIVRFHQAIPVLLLSALPRDQTLAPQQSLDCVVCPAWSDALPGMLEKTGNPESPKLGIAIPVSAIGGSPSGSEKVADELRKLISNFHPVLVTTSGDVPDSAYLKGLHKLWNSLIA